MTTTPTQFTANPVTPDPLAVARGLIASAMHRGAAMPDSAALALAQAWDDIEDSPGPSNVVEPAGEQPATPTELLLRARIALRQAIPGVRPARRALRLASAIRHLDRALGQIEGWADGGPTR